jgi:hypothetical protein
MLWWDLGGNLLQAGSLEGYFRILRFRLVRLRVRLRPSIWSACLVKLELEMAG